MDMQTAEQNIKQSIAYHLYSNDHHCSPDQMYSILISEIKTKLTLTMKSGGVEGVVGLMDL